MSKWVVIVVLLGLPLLVVGQVQPPSAAQKKYDQEAIYLKAGFWRSYYIKGMRSYPLGLGFRRLKQELEVSPLALNEFKSFQRARRTNLALTFIGLAGWAAAPLLTSVSEEAAATSFVGGSVALVAAIPLSFRANNRLAKSVWLYNRSVVSDAETGARK